MIYVVLFQLTIFSIKIKILPWVDKNRGKGGCRVEEDKDEKREGPDLASMRMDDWCWCLFRRQIWDAPRLVWEKSWEKTSISPKSKKSFRHKFSPFPLIFSLICSNQWFSFVLSGICLFFLKKKYHLCIIVEGNINSMVDCGTDFECHVVVVFTVKNSHLMGFQ